MKTTGLARPSAGAPDGTTRVLVVNLGWIALIAVAVTAAAAVVSWTRTPTYRSKAEVLVQARATRGVPLQTVDMGTEKAIASSGAVLSIAAKSLGISQPQLTDRLTVAVPVDAQVLDILYTDHDRAVARARAQGVADAFVAYSLTDGNLSKSTQTRVITRATLPVSPASPNHLIDVGVALILGLALGVGVVLLRDRLDDRLRGPRDLEVRVGAPLLAAVPAYRRSAHDATALVAVNDPASLPAEAYRDLRTRLFRKAARQNGRVLLVTSAAGDEHATVAANLAASVATCGRRVTLVCCDLRGGDTAALFGLAGGAGVSDVVQGLVPPRKALRPGGIANLQVLPAGPAVPDPGAVVQASAFRLLVDELAESTELVVVDGPALLAGADAGALAQLSDMILFAADARSTTRGQVDAAMRELDPSRSRLIGCVLDNVGKTGLLSKAPRPPATAPTGPAEPTPAADQTATKDLFAATAKAKPKARSAAGGEAEAEAADTPAAGDEADGPPADGDAVTTRPALEDLNGGDDQR
jgi:polysaccharide biosynthesis transport protein